MLLGIILVHFDVLKGRLIEAGASISFKRLESFFMVVLVV